MVPEHKEPTESIITYHSSLSDDTESVESSENSEDNNEDESGRQSPEEPEVLKGREYPAAKVQESTQALSPAQSPDVESLSVAKFPAYTFGSLDTAETLPEQSVSVIRNDGIDFDQVCERLLEDLIAPDGRPTFMHQSGDGSTLSSSQSSTRLFSGPPSSSSSSSVSSLATVERMEFAKTALVADQAALNAKLKLAAARDALKKVKHNVADVPTTCDVYRRPTSTRAMTTVPAKVTRSVSTNSLTANIRSTLPKSKSHTSLPSPDENASVPRSSRSCRRSSRDSQSLVPMKNDIKIGVAAPKKLTASKATTQEQPLVRRSSTKSKKTSIYVPKSHITSIHEVMA